MKTIDSIITKRKLSDGRSVYCDRITTSIIMNQAFPKEVVGPMSVTLKEDLYILEGSTNPTNGLMYLFFVVYNGATENIEDAVLVKDSSNPRFYLLPAALPEKVVNTIQKHVKDFVIEMINNPTESLSTLNKGISEEETFFPDLNKQPGVNPQWNGRINI